MGSEPLVPGTLRSFQLPCVCGQSSVSCVPVLRDTGLLRSHLLSGAHGEGLMWMEGRGEKEPGHQRRAGLGSSAVGLGCARGAGLSRSLLL